MRQAQGGIAATMDYQPAIHAAARDPRGLEDLYQSARATSGADAFARALEDVYTTAPENLLYAAWHERLQRAMPEEHAATRHPADWRLAVALSAGLGLVLWLLSDPAWTIAGTGRNGGGPSGVPWLAVLWAPITALFLIAFLALATRAHYARSALIGAGLVAITAYVVARTLALDTGSNVGGAPNAQQTYLALMLPHLPLLSAAAVGLALLGWRSSADDRFGFLTKSIEVIATAGVAAIAGGIFVGLTYAIFQAIGVEIPDLLVRLLIAGGGGLIPILAVAAVYDPLTAPRAQEFRRGLGKILAILMRALLPLTLLVLAIYLLVIPFNFGQPFNNRGVLIVYNVMLFAIVALLAGVTPVSPEDVPARWRRPLRAGIAALAALAAVISLYALAAILYRTTQDGLTMNRVVVIGWNAINIGLLLLALYRQARAGREGWIGALHGALRLGTAVYVVWGLALVLALSWVF
ncbi:MAG TPA: hypothetical protein VLJ14_14555 [Ktedonobacterales bacterium]|nr:hypothetical protein [Ktedonobacterales bacterium]